MGRDRLIAAMLGGSMAMVAARAQQAELFISHDDPDGMVEPGQVVRMEIRLNWSGVFQVAALRGDVTASPGLGEVSGQAGPSPGSYFTPWSSSLGAPVDGGLRAIALEFIWIGFTGGLVLPCVSGCNAVWCGTWVSWDWTAPVVEQPTQVAFGFTARAGETGLAGYVASTPLTTPMGVEVVGTALTVTPAPGSAACLLSGVGLRSLRRRRSSFVRTIPAFRA